MNISLFQKKITKGFLEFLLIVVGVTIALWLENVAEDMKEREIEQEYLISFENDVSKDIKRLEISIKNNKAILSKVEKFLQDLINAQLTANNLMENIGSITSYDYFTPDDFTLTSIRESGDFRLLRNDKVKREILELKRSYDQVEVLQINFQNALDNQIIPLIIENVNMVNGQLVNPSFISDHRLASMVGYVHSDTQGRIKQYQASKRAAESLLVLLQTTINF